VRLTFRGARQIDRNLISWRHLGRFGKLATLPDTGSREFHKTVDLIKAVADAGTPLKILLPESRFLNSFTMMRWWFLTWLRRSSNFRA